VSAKSSILLVDDETSLLKATARRLEILGYHVTTVERPTAALDLVTARPTDFDLLITDRAVFGFPEGKLTLLELMPGETLDTVRAVTSATFATERV